MTAVSLHRLQCIKHSNFILERNLMEIRKTTPDELELLLKMYENARMFMASHGNPTQWGTSYPSRELVAEDISTGCSYVCIEHGKIIATFYYKEGDDSTYTHIYSGQWLNEHPYGAVHRITADGSVRGAASFCLEWAYQQCGNLKIDTHRDNTVMQHLLEKNGFTYCGVIYTDNGSERLAYQKCEK